MTVFGAYSEYYDLLYTDKDYVGEVAFISGLLDEYAPGARSLLELGCGSGRHAAMLAEQDRTVHGIDISEEMLAKPQAGKEVEGVGR